MKSMFFELFKLAKDEIHVFLRFFKHAKNEILEISPLEMQIFSHSFAAKRNAQNGGEGCSLARECYEATDCT